MKFILLNGEQWLTKNTWKTVIKPKKKKEPQSEPVDSLTVKKDIDNANDLRNSYGFKGKPFNIDKNFV